MANGKKSGSLRLYKSYMFREKDPVIDIIRSMITGQKIGKICEASGVARQTVNNWFFGTTRRPQFATIQAFATAAGNPFITSRAVTLVIERKVRTSSMKKKVASKKKKKAG